MAEWQTGCQKVCVFDRSYREARLQELIAYDLLLVGSAFDGFSPAGPCVWIYQ